MANKKVRSLLAAYNRAKEENSGEFCDGCFSKDGTITVKQQLPSSTTEISKGKEQVRKEWKMNTWQVEDIVLPFALNDWSIETIEALPKSKRGVHLPCMKCGEIRFLKLNDVAFPRFLIDLDNSWEEFFIVKRGGKDNEEYVNLVPVKDQ